MIYAIDFEMCYFIYIYEPKQNSSLKVSFTKSWLLHLKFTSTCIVECQLFDQLFILTLFVFLSGRGSLDFISIEHDLVENSLTLVS